MLTAVQGQRQFSDDSPPTILLDQSRVTNPTNWPPQASAQPPAPWQQPARKWT